MITLPTLTLATGTMGSGKTYSRVQFAMSWLKSRKSSRIITNLPLCVENWPKNRVLLFPEKDTRKWAKESKDENPPGPWEFCKENAKPGDLVIIDEVQHFIPNRGKVEQRYAWLRWITELRHEGLYLQIVTQHPDQCDERILKLAEEEHISIDVDKKRDPAFLVPLGDWKALFQAMAPRWKPPRTVGVEIRRRTGRKQEVVGTSKHTLTEAGFRLYNSYSASQTTGKEGKDNVSRREFLLYFRESYGAKIAGRAFTGLAVAGGIYYSVFHMVPDILLGVSARLANNRAIDSKESESGITEPANAHDPGNATAPAPAGKPTAFPPGHVEL